jgi:hypothetical protein
MARDNGMDGNNGMSAPTRMSSCRHAVMPWQRGIASWRN